MNALRTLALCLCFSASIAAQTLGVNNVNNYWITPGGTPGGYSCKSLTVVTPATITMNVSCANFGAIFAIVWSSCPCTACLVTPPMGTSACLPPPTTACPSSNQFLELTFAPGCPNIILTGTVNSAGGAAIPLSIPLVSSPVTLGTQAVFLAPATCVVAPFNVMVSQGWNVTFI